MKFFTVTVSHIEIRMYHLQKLYDWTFVEIYFHQFIFKSISENLDTIVLLFDHYSRRQGDK